MRKTATSSIAKDLSSQIDAISETAEIVKKLRLASQKQPDEELARLLRAITKSLNIVAEKATRMGEKVLDRAA